MKYTQEIQKQALALAEEIRKNGVATHKAHKLTCLKDIQNELGPNPLALRRYAKKFGGDITGVPRKVTKLNKNVEVKGKK